MRWIALLLTLALSGCLNRPHQTTLPDGSSGFVINRCRYLQTCLAKAQQMCQGPYDLQSQSESFPNGFTIMVSCKKK